MKPVVHLVQNDGCCRRATARLLRSNRYEVIEYASASDLLAANPQGAGCIITDVKMTRLDGLEMQDCLARLGSALVVVFMTDNAEIHDSVRAIKAGAEDFLINPVKDECLLDAVDRALARSSQAVRNRSERSTACSLVSTLTAREREVISHVVYGKRNKQIAYELGTAERTIKAHRKKIMDKLHAGSLVDLMTIADRAGLSTLLTLRSPSCAANSAVVVQPALSSSTTAAGRPSMASQTAGKSGADIAPRDNRRVLADDYV